MNTLTTDTTSHGPAAEALAAVTELNRALTALDGLTAFGRGGPEGPAKADGLILGLTGHSAYPGPDADLVTWAGNAATTLANRLGSASSTFRTLGRLLAGVRERAARDGHTDAALPAFTRRCFGDVVTLRSPCSGAHVVAGVWASLRIGHPAAAYFPAAGLPHGPGVGAVVVLTGSEHDHGPFDLTVVRRQTAVYRADLEQHRRRQEESAAREERERQARLQADPMHRIRLLEEALVAKSAALTAGGT
jgi:hypothetical protein